ncbi:unnamed protein product, partial [Discosporangium mesarthrocarpum]
GKTRWEWITPEVVGTSPSARTGHAAVLLPDSKTILVQGGWDPEDEGGVRHFEDSFLLDTELWEWRKGPVIGAGARASAGEVATLARAGHTGVLAKGGGGGKRPVVAFFGGQDEGGVRRSDLGLLESLDA